MQPIRRTKIVATVGPSTDNPRILEGLIRTGADVARINFSHGDGDSHIQRVRMIRECAAAADRDIAILMDLQGPKIRIECFRRGPITLRKGDRFVLDADLPTHEGTQEQVGITYKALPQDITTGDVLVLDDGRISLDVETVDGNRIVCRVGMGGKLSDKKGINRVGGGLSAPALTTKDRKDIRLAAQCQADYLAVSFPRSADDIEEARELLRSAGGYGAIIAKIERAEALNHMEAIIQASDAVMIARGDLGVEIGDAELPGVQKRIIRQAQQMNRVSITATQMMESMIHSPTPTRAEVLDVANAVMDGSDAVMLSAETAAGDYPVKAIQAMARVCLGAEKQQETRRSRHRLDSQFDYIDEAIAMAAMYTANHMGARAIIALTESGSTTLWMSRISSGIPIYAFTRHEATRRRVTLYRGVYPINFDVTHIHSAVIIKEAIEVLLRRGAVRDGDLVLVTKGDATGIPGGSNTMKIIRVGDLFLPEDL